MKRLLVMFGAAEGLLALLFAVVVLTHGVSAVAYWALAGLVGVNLVIGICLLCFMPRAKRTKGDQP